jgi:hypothetical protein
MTAEQERDEEARAIERMAQAHRRCHSAHVALLKEFIPRGNGALAKRPWMNMTPRRPKFAQLALTWIELRQRFARVRGADRMMQRTFKASDCVRLRSGGLPGTAVATIREILPGGSYVPLFWRRADGTEWESGSANQDIEMVADDEAEPKACLTKLAGRVGASKAHLAAQAVTLRIDASDP